MEQSQGRVAVNKREKARFEITLGELAAAGKANNTVYKAVGKAFIMSTVPTLTAEINTKVLMCDNEIATAARQMTQFEESIKATEHELQTFH